MDEQILSLAPKVGLYDSGDAALSAGVLYMRAFGPADAAAGMAFVVGTKGSRDKSFTCGLGLGYIAEEDEAVDFAEHPVLLLGGNIRLSETIPTLGLTAGRAGRAAADGPGWRPQPTIGQAPRMLPSCRTRSSKRSDCGSGVTGLCPSR